MKYEIESRDGYILVKTFGSADVDVYREALEKIFNHPDWPGCQRYIFDHGQLDASTLTKAHMQRIGEIAREKRAIHGVKKSASVAPTDLAFGNARMFMVFAQDGKEIPTNAFRTLEEAEVWVREK